MNNSEPLGKEKIGKLLIQFSIPSIISMIANSFYVIIDRMFVGRVVGPLAISGMTVTFPISLVVMAFGMLVGIGAGSLISIRLGEQKKEEAEKILGNAFSLIVLVSITLSAICLIFLDPLLAAFGASPEILPYAKQFISIILYGTIFQLIAFGLSAVVRAQGEPRTAMNILLLNAGLNIILDWVFIYLLHYGIKGTAIATIISQFVSSVWVLIHLTGKGSLLKLRFGNLPLKKDVILGIFSIGMAPFAMQLAASLVTIIFNQTLSRYGGDLAIGALGIISSIAMFLLMPAIGVTQGAQPIIGYNYGAKNFNRVKEAVTLAIIAASAVSILGFVIVQTIPSTLMSFFSNDPQLIALGVKGLRLFLLMMPILGFQVVAASFFQAIGKAKISLFLTLSRQVIFLIPLLLILPPIFRIQGVWVGPPISDFLSTILSGVFLLKEWRKLKTA